MQKSAKMHDVYPPCIFCILLRTAASPALEGLAIGTLLDCWVSLVSTHSDVIERAIIFICTMILALRYSTFDALVCLIVHYRHLCIIFLCIGTKILYPA